MLFVIEGPDRVGKTTLFTRLCVEFPALRAVAAPKFDPKLMPMAELIQHREVFLWRQLYDPGTDYLCDRSPFISNIVYSHLYGRTVPSYPWISKEIRCVYLRPDTYIYDEIQAEETWKRAIGLYDWVVPNYEHITIDNRESAFYIAAQWIRTFLWEKQ